MENHEPGGRKARTPMWPSPSPRAAACPPALRLPRLSNFPAGPNPLLSKAGPNSLVPDSCHLGPGRREFQGAETHCSDLEWTPVSVVAQSAMIPPSSGSPAAPFILNDVHLSHYIWPPPTGRIKSVLIRLRGVPAWTLSEQGGFRPRGQSRLLPWSRGMTAVAPAGPARGELPWARRRRCRVASCPFPRASS